MPRSSIVGEVTLLRALAGVPVSVGRLEYDGSLPDVENLSEEVLCQISVPDETEADHRQRVTKSLLRQHRENRALAWEALGELVKADRERALLP